MRGLALCVALAACHAADAASPPAFAVANVPVTWSASAGTITSAGLYTAPMVGGVYRVFASAGGKTDTATYTVCVANKLTVSPTSLTLTDGDTASLTATVTNSCGVITTADSVVWSSSATGKATVAATSSRLGLVTAVDTGSALITATLGTVSKTVPVTIVATDTTTPPASGCDTANTALMLSSTFDQGTVPFPRIVNDEDYFSGLWIGQVGTASYNLQKSSTQFRECSFSARIELRRTDPIIAGSNRAQIMVDHAAGTGNGGVSVPGGQSLSGGLGTERWFGFSIYVPSDWVLETSWAPETIFEVINGGRSPFFEIEIDRSNWAIISRTGHGPQNDPSWVTSVVNTPLTRGIWTDWVIHAVWSGSGTGTLQVWKNGTQVVNRTSANTAFTDIGSSSKPSWGIYKWSWGGSTSGGNSIVSSRYLFVDAIRVTDGAHGSYTVVAPR